MKAISRLHLIMLGVVLALAAPHRAQAGSVACTAAGPTLSFGTVNPYSGYPYPTSGYIAVTCSNTTAAAATVTGCLSIGTGSGGTTPTNRTLASGGNTLAFQINQGGASPQIGNGSGFAMAGPYSTSVPVNNTTPQNFPVALTIPSPGSAPIAGSYASSFSGTDAQIIYVVNSSPSTCTALVGASPSVTQANFTVSATVPTQCKVTASGMTFPPTGVLKTAVTATATVTTTCNATVPVTIALDYGVTGTGPTARIMKSGSNAITYGIYRDSGWTLPWGKTSGSDTASLPNGTGTLTAYGQVLPQISPAPGTYGDTVNVSITY